MQHCVLWLRADYKHWPRLVYRQQCMVTLLMFHRLAREHASHLVYNESSSVKSCLSLWTCSVLFQLMSTAGPLARCSEFNEKWSWRDFFSSFFCVRQKIGQRALKGKWWLISTIFTLKPAFQFFCAIIFDVAMLSNKLCQQVKLFRPLRFRNGMRIECEGASWLLFILCTLYDTLHILDKESAETHVKMEPYVILFSFSRP